MVPTTTAEAEPMEKIPRKASVFRGFLSDKLEFICQIYTAPKPPLPKGRWQPARADGGILQNNTAILHLFPANS